MADSQMFVWHLLDSMVELISKYQNCSDFELDLEDDGSPRVSFRVAPSISATDLSGYAQDLLLALGCYCMKAEVVKVENSHLCVVFRQKTGYGYISATLGRPRPDQIVLITVRLDPRAAADRAAATSGALYGRTSPVLC